MGSFANMVKARQQLDILLKYMYDKREEARAVDIEEIKNDKKLLEMGGNKSELERMVLKLRDDKMIQIYPDYYRFEDGKQDIKRGMFTFCTITFDGRLFYEDGGYVRQQEIILKTESQKDRREKQLLYGTWAVAFGAVGLVIWEIIKTFWIEKT